MSSIRQLVQSYSSFFQDVAKVQNPKTYLQGLPDTYQRNLLLFLMKPYHDQYKQNLTKEFKLSKSLINEIVSWKSSQKIEGAQTAEQIQQHIEDFKKQSQNIFNYPKPTDLHQRQGEGQMQAQDTIPNKLEYIQPLNQWVAQLLKNRPQHFQQLTSQAIMTLSDDFLINMSVQNKRKVFQNDILLHRSQDFCTKFITKYFEQSIQVNKNFQLSERQLNLLSNSKFNQIKNDIPALKNNRTYLSQWFNRQFSEELQKYQKQQLNITEKNQKRSALIEIHHKLKSMENSKLLETRRKILLEILDLDIQREDYSNKLLFQYLEQFLPYQSLYIKPELREEYKSKKRQPCLNISYQFLTNSEEALIDSYIRGLLVLPDAQALCQNLKKYFQQSMVNRLYGLVKLQQGEDWKLVQKYISSEQIKNIRQSKKLKILDKTKSKLKVNDDVELNLQLKNITDLQIKVFKVDLEKSQLENIQISKTQDLGYLSPTDLQPFQIDETNPFKQIRRDVKIPSISNKRGMWIVELSAADLTSRAVIYKGGIVSSTKLTSQGLELSFYNEVGEKIQNLYLWINRKKHQVKDYHVIPYGAKSQQVEVIAVYDDLAIKQVHQVPKQAYNFRVGYIYGSESFISGNKAKIILHPQLTINQTKVSLQLLKKVKVRVQLTNNLNIKNSLEFDNIKLKNQQDYVLQFPVQSYTKNISLSIEGSIKLLNSQEQKVKSQKTIDISLGQHNSNFLQLYLKKNASQGYCVYVFGKNGEPIPRSEVTVSFMPKGRHQEESYTLLTNKQGSVILGQVQKHTDRLIAKVRSNAGEITRQWIIRNLNNQFHLKPIYYISQGEQLNLSCPLNKEDVILVRKGRDGYMIEKVNNHLQFDSGRLKICNLSVGSYKLQNLCSVPNIEILVKKKSKWQNESQIYNEQQGMLLNLPQNSHQQIGFQEPIIQEVGTKLKIQIPLSSNSEQYQIKAHLLASNYVTPELEGLFKVEDYIRVQDVNRIYFKVPKCEFFNNKTLSEEASYVLNRRNQKKYVGNNLQKPRIFLKRMQVRDTSEMEQLLRPQMDYQNRERMRPMMAHKCLAPQCISRRSSPMVYPCKSKKMHQKIAIRSNQITSHNNFIALPGEIVSNQKGKHLQFTVLKCYSHFQLIVLTQNTAIEKIFDYGLAQTSHKSLIHAGIPDSKSSQAWTMSREIYKVSPGESIKVGRDSTWCAVGIQSILNFANIKGVQLEKWLNQWSASSYIEKLAFYNDRVCHELNCFIKHNDPEFFSKVVRPFIANKVTKTFVDYCLLESDKCLDWLPIQKLQKLNDFERVLMIKELMRIGKQEEAFKIAQAMNDYSRANKISFNIFKQQFDTVITAKPQKNKGQHLNLAQAPHQHMRAMENQEDQYSLQDQCQMEICEDQEQEQEQIKCNTRFKKRQQYKQPFKQMQKTKQYTQTTYKGLKNLADSSTIIPSSPFWPSVAMAVAKKQDKCLTENFIYLTTQREFTLATCFIPKQKVLQYDLSTQGGDVILNAKSPFLVFVKEIKELVYEKKFGVMLNQRFFNPDDMYYYEDDGTRIEKEVKQFLISKTYMLQTLVTNTSGSQLELQLLIDIPKGSLPLSSNQYTQIQNITLQPYTTKEFQRNFYFPDIVDFEMYPANASRGSYIIAKAQRFINLNVCQLESRRLNDSLENVMKSGDTEKIVEFLKKKNIFDPRVFEITDILWMVRDQKFYKEVIQIFRQRRYFQYQIWAFGYYHSDLQAIKELQSMRSPRVFPSDFSIFQYFPYYSSRTHRFQNENKSTIRNNEFKNTYYEFLFSKVLCQMPKHYIIVFIYYLLLQDRIDEASILLSKVESQIRKECALQFDYIECFVDMYKGYPTFQKARKIVKNYENYEVKFWRQMFAEVSATLKDYDSEEAPKVVEKKVQFEPKVLNQGYQLRLSIPPESEMQVLIYEINLELYFSMYPFESIKNLCSFIVPNTTITYSAGQNPKQEIVTRPTNLKDSIVEVYNSKNKLMKRKVKEFQWHNPKIQIDIKEELGIIQVYYDNKKSPQCYCKVYQLKNGSSKFYRDGYTDITGTFKYALANLDGIRQFAVLVATEHGGNVIKVKPPSQQGYY